MRILIHSNAPWVATGYGQQTAQLARRLKKAGHEVAVSAFYGLSGAMSEWEGVPIYPNGMHPYGNDVLYGHAEHWFDGDIRSGLVITLVDAWVLPVGLLREMNVVCWTPVDHDPAPEGVVQTLKESGALALAMSRHGQRMLVDGGLEAAYAPHGIDTDMLSPKDKTEARDRLGIPHDRFVVGMVAANKGKPSRKGFGEAFQAFAAFNRKHPDSLLYLHTEVTGVCDGVNLVKLALACGIPVDAVVPMHQYQGFILGWPPEHMAYVYSAMDVLLNPANGEGFGIPVIEAQACGVPVVVTDHTAMSEVGKVGWQVPGQKWWTTQESWAKIASVEKLTGALCAARDRGGRLAAKAREHALTYNADRVFDEHWVPLLAGIQAQMDAPAVELVPRAPVVEVLAA